MTAAAATAIAPPRSQPTRMSLGQWAPRYTIAKPMNANTNATNHPASAGSSADWTETKPSGDRRGAGDAGVGRRHRRTAEHEDVHTARRPRPADRGLERSIHRHCDHECGAGCDHETPALPAHDKRCRDDPRQHDDAVDRHIGHQLERQRHRADAVIGKEFKDPEVDRRHQPVGVSGPLSFDGRDGLPGAGSVSVPSPRPGVARRRSNSRPIHR